MPACRPARWKRCGRWKQRTRGRCCSRPSKSKHNRVAANASPGSISHRGNRRRSVCCLTWRASSEAPAFRISALWAIGETQDARFLPFLMEQFKSSEGRIRLAVTRALGNPYGAGKKPMRRPATIRFRVSQARADPDGKRRFALVLSSQPAHDLSRLTPMEFALWEAGELIEDYEVKLSGRLRRWRPALLRPRFMSTGDPYGQAIDAALSRSSALKTSPTTCGESTAIPRIR